MYGPWQEKPWHVYRKVGVHGHFYEVGENVHHFQYGQKSKERAWKTSPNNSLDYWVTDRDSLGYLPWKEIFVIL